MNYEYMKEYECNGVKPDLDDDVKIKLRDALGKEACGHVTVGTFAKTSWSYINKFKIVDERYKPKAEPDVVHRQKQYQFFDGIEAIEVIASSMTVEQFRGYCMGNKLKYCLRAGKKGDATEDLQKAYKYDELFHKYEHLCRE